MANPYELLNFILDTAGEPAAGDNVKINGEDPVFPTPFATGDASAAAIAAGAYQAGELWKLRTGREQTIEVDVDAAGANMRSRRYLSVKDAPSRMGGGGLGQVGRYRTRDGRWIQFQRTFKHHQEAQLRALGCEPDEEAIKAAVAKRDALELEEAVIAEGATPGFVRTHAEWAAIDHAKTLDTLPLFHITKIGESEPEPFAAGARPLSGIRVLDLTRVLAGPTGGRTLAEHGADVLRVGTDAFPDDRTMMMDTGHGKRSTELDLKSKEGADALWALVPGADVFSQGYRPGAIAGLGFSPEDLAARRPGIVYVSLSAFGREGSWSGRRGFDSVFQSVSGIADELGTENGPGGLSGNPLDYITGYLAAFGALVALGRRASEGGSYHVQVSLAQTGTWVNKLGRIDAARVAAVAPELSDERTAELTTETETKFGLLTHLLPVARMSETPPHWDLPSAPLANNPPEWAD